MSSKPICNFSSGTTVRVTDIDGGCGARSRVLALGLTPGCPVEIVDASSTGCRVKARGAEVVLCCGLANKVIAEEIPAGSGPVCSCCAKAS